MQENNKKKLNTFKPKVEEHPSVEERVNIFSGWVLKQNYSSLHKQATIIIYRNFLKAMPKPEAPKINKET